MDVFVLFTYLCVQSVIMRFLPHYPCRSHPPVLFPSLIPTIISHHPGLIPSLFFTLSHLPVLFPSLFPHYLTLPVFSPLYFPHYLTLPVLFPLCFPHYLSLCHVCHINSLPHYLPPILFLSFCFSPSFFFIFPTFLSSFFFSFEDINFIWCRHLFLIRLFHYSLPSSLSLFSHL
uniref:Uncharacterized protein n=1 Tax=Cacopsylla melanoneura TaxID=428564 RepID=A0A8D9B041_9HEMI